MFGFVRFALASGLWYGMDPPGLQKWVPERIHTKRCRAQYSLAQQWYNWPADSRSEQRAVAFDSRCNSAFDLPEPSIVRRSLRFGLNGTAVAPGFVRGRAATPGVQQAQPER